MFDYSQQPITDLLSRLGVFFAFSKQQYNEQAKQGVEYSHFGGGGFCPIENTQGLNDGLDEIQKNAIALTLKNHSKEDIIYHELANYESWYTSDIEPALDTLKKYQFTREDVIAVYQKFKHEMMD